MSTATLSISLPPTPPIPPRSAARNTNANMLSFSSPTSNPGFYDGMQHHPYASLADYESDYEPLLSASANTNPFRDPSLTSSARVSTSTATQDIVLESNGHREEGRAKKGRHTNMYTNPPPPSSALPSTQDENAIIPAIVTNVIPAHRSTPPSSSTAKPSLIRSPSFLKRLRSNSEEKEREKEEKGVLKVVYMPRKDYKRYFARGLRGEYVGSEPYRRWREEELEEAFGRYKPVRKGTGRGKM